MALSTSTSLLHTFVNNVKCCSVFIYTTCLLIKDVNAGEFCLVSDWPNYNTEYCNYGCCTRNLQTVCCGADVGTIVGAVIGCLIIIAIIVAVAICCCKKNTTRGRVIKPQQGAGGAVTVVHTNNMIGQPAGGHAMTTQQYAGPGVYSGPGQYQHVNPYNNPAYSAHGPPPPAYTYSNPPPPAYPAPPGQNPAFPPPQNPAFPPPPNATKGGFTNPAAPAYPPNPPT